MLKRAMATVKVLPRRAVKMAVTAAVTVRVSVSPFSTSMLGAATATLLTI